MGFRRVFGEALPLPGTHQEQAPTVLGDTEVQGVKDLIVLFDLIALSLELRADLPKKPFVLANRQAADIFEDEIFRLQLRNDPHEVAHKAIAWIVQGAFPDHAEPLAWGAPENHVNVGFPDFRLRANVISVDVRNATADCRAFREIIFVRGGVDWVVLDRRGYTETCLLKPERQAAGSGEEVNANRLSPTPFHRLMPS